MSKVATMGTMRIGIYDPYLDDLGGGEKYMMSLATALSEKHTVDIFWDKKEDLVGAQDRFGLALINVRQVQNIFNGNMSFLKRFSETRKYDVIIFLSDGSIPFVGSKKLLIHIQQPIAKMHIRSLWDKIKLSRVTNFFCNSQYTKSYIGKIFSLKTLVIYPPVALHPKHVEKENYILHVGRFRLVDPLTHAGDYKKQHIMLEVFRQMIEEGLKGWKFILAVSVRDKDMMQFEKMKESVKDLPVEFLINKTNDTLWDMYSRAKIYWHASGYGEDLSVHPEYAEHFGISTVEAMGAGAVPVVINAGGQCEIVSNGVDGLVWNTLQELKEMTQQIMHDKLLWEKLSVNAKKRARDFSYERFSETVNALVV